jgi:phosphatidylethanolamine/phosphatidyl-N-methylethanolamine N-methyltransferase
LEQFTFFKQFLAAPGKVGALTASSRALANKVAEMGLVEQADVVVEFGTGTGIITAAVAARIPSHTHFLAMEISPKFAKLTRERCPRATVINDSAVFARKYLDEIGAAHCDSIVSGLPWSTFSDNLQNELLNCILESLRPGGLFVNYGYVHAPILPNGRRFREVLRDRFSTVTTSSIVWKNFPPAFVYCAMK